MDLNLKHMKLVRRKLKPRGNPAALKPYQFKPGPDPRRNVTSGPHSQGFKRFADMYVEELMRPANDKDALELGLKPGASNFQCLIAGMVKAAGRGDTTAAREIREVLEGKTIIPVVQAHISAQMQHTNALQQVRDSLLKELCLDQPEATTLEAQPPAPALSPAKRKAGSRRS